VTRYAAEPLGRPAGRPADPRPGLAVGSPSRVRRVAPPLLLAGGLLAASIALHVRDPHQSGSWGYCPWLVLTGTACPGCGGLRAVNDLTRGDVAAAFSSNALFVASLPLFAGMWTTSVVHRWRDERRPLPPAVIAWAGGTALALVLVFWVVRNLPFASYLAP
jgi:hypothetical protein